jgi:hydroxymethylpyrimidine/phosphomethylpyrimidine kinase
MTEPTHHSPPSGRVLIIAGSDSGGGAGIQGDIKTVSALGGYAMTAITALTAQNTLGVFGIHPIPEAFIAQQIDLCLSDIGADAIKTGMLHSAGVIETVVSCLDAHSGGKPSPLGGEGLDEGAANRTQANFHIPSPNPLPQGERACPASPLVPIPLIVDPVMVAKGGAPLLEAAALHALKTLLIPAATIITPNLPEAELLLGRSIASGDADATDMKRAAEELLGLGCEAVLLKGGHGTGDVLTDILVTRHQAPGTKHLLTLTAKRIATLSTHGTGCTFASAIATGLAQKQTLHDAVVRAHAYVQAAIARAPNFGKGNGPLGH